MVAILRHRQDRLRKVEAHGVFVERLDGVLDPHHDRLALLVLLAAVLAHGAEGRETDVRGAEARSQPALDVPDDVIGDQFLAVVPHHALAQLEGPGLQVLRRGPAFRQHRPGDVVRACHRQVFDDMARLVRHLDPRECRRILHLLDRHADTKLATLLGLRIVGREGGILQRPSRRRDARHGIGGARRHAQKGSDADEFATVHPAVLHHLIGFVDFRMIVFARFEKRHVSSLGHGYPARGLIRGSLRLRGVPPYAANGNHIIFDCREKHHFQFANYCKKQFNVIEHTVQGAGIYRCFGFAGCLNYRENCC